MKNKLCNFDKSAHDLNPLLPELKTGTAQHKDEQ